MHVGMEDSITTLLQHYDLKKWANTIKRFIQITKKVFYLIVSGHVDRKVFCGQILRSLSEVSTTKHSGDEWIFVCDAHSSKRNRHISKTKQLLG